MLAASAAAAFSASSARAARLPLKKAVYWSMTGNTLSVPDRMKLIKSCGFEEVELPTMPDKAAAEEALDSAKKAGVRIHSVMNSDHWKFPLSAADPAVVEKSMACMEASLRNAKMWGSDSVLLVPAVVNETTSYKEAWDRSAKQIKKLMPLAKELKVVIGVEEVWNKFLLSPLEMATYVDSFNSPWVKAYFDVGNVVFYGYPQDWIRTLGKRICKLHIKDFKYELGRTQFVNLHEGQINWKAVHQAIADIGYQGTATLELASGDEAYLQDVSKRFDRILDGA